MKRKSSREKKSSFIEKKKYLFTTHGVPRIFAQVLFGICIPLYGTFGCIDLHPLYFIPTYRIITFSIYLALFIFNYICLYLFFLSILPLGFSVSSPCHWYPSFLFFFTFHSMHIEKSSLSVVLLYIFLFFYTCIFYIYEIFICRWVNKLSYSDSIGRVILIFLLFLLLLIRMCMVWK